MKLVSFEAPARATGHSPPPQSRGLQKGNKNIETKKFFKVFQGIARGIAGGGLGGGSGRMGGAWGALGVSIFNSF